jgi:hypothetical protein
MPFFVSFRLLLDDPQLIHLTGGGVHLPAKTSGLAAYKRGIR